MLLDILLFLFLGVVNVGLLGLIMLGVLRVGLRVVFKFKLKIKVVIKG